MLQYIVLLLYGWLFFSSKEKRLFEFLFAVTGTK